MDGSEGIGILLVEDNPRDAEMTLRALQKRNLANQIVWVQDGAEALDFILGRQSGATRLSHFPKVILLDLKLPKVDGIEVLQKLKADARAKNIPVVVLTSSREDADMAICYALGVNSYIVKPVNFDNFSEAVAQLGMYWLLLNEPLKHPGDGGA